MKDILNISYQELESTLAELQQPRYRTTQIWEWLYKHRVRSFAEMLNLPASLRSRLAELFVFQPISPEHTAISTDGTRKTIFRLFDNHVVEGVLIPAKDGRITACISSQVGCTLRCAFCATARIPFRRNLTIGEIVDQVGYLDATARSEYGHGLSNIVYMGMGEPLANYDAVSASLRIISSETGLGFAPRRITLSTAGLVPEIKRLADEDLGIQFAVSLHAADEPTRRSLMSAGRDYSLQELADAIRYWYKRTGSRVTLEYLVLAGKNDTSAHQQSLIRYAGSLPVKINVIEYNPIVGIPFSAGSPADLDAFASVLAAAGLTVTVRHSGGKDIDAACGQLAARKLPQTADMDQSSTGSNR
ncbi:23S rRNA (adenine(2503)-C(2))-methyltransferase RlmN [Spirochaeta africana]|uniref:Probable dual-specificity RNA methyltransferase RlmN n=1 Tax=Spirochaeta africana (strain ATCC 700263 / DSM 8902 / Z-7692) TaxID=889378 RepID=H9ULR8_SPIAZ|nr:23S rRNA (adenine(2503)-C(2))-methyltransferase RlmN [Spirochaeta africana]AFG38461.1 23S rRNA m2A2503 methyltransferase [Spirochaeta africana DSM 8902]